jgi:hypothetical protein
MSGKLVRILSFPLLIAALWLAGSGGWPWR